jgi:hypothetical protein
MDDFTKLCANEFAVHVERLFESERARALAAGKKCVNVPFLDDSFPVDCKLLSSHYKRTVAAALSARDSFERQKPSWAPSLPLRSADIDKLIRNVDDPRSNLVGYFAASWACASWSKYHPPLFVYASGVMACPDTPKHIRVDARLRREFPPVPTLLAKLDQTLCWNTVERTIEFAQQLMRQEEHLQRCGMPADAERMQMTIKHITGVELVDPD